MPFRLQGQLIASTSPPDAKAPPEPLLCPFRGPHPKRLRLRRTREVTAAQFLRSQGQRIESKKSRNILLRYLAVPQGILKCTQDSITMIKPLLPTPNVEHVTIGQALLFARRRVKTMVRTFDSDGKWEP